MTLMPWSRTEKYDVDTVEAGWLVCDCIGEMARFSFLGNSFATLLPIRRVCLGLFVGCHGLWEFECLCIGWNHLQRV